MKTYTLHVAADAAPGDAGTLERAVLVKDGFSWAAMSTMSPAIQSLWAKNQKNEKANAPQEKPSLTRTARSSVPASPGAASAATCRV